MSMSELSVKAGALEIAIQEGCFCTLPMKTNEEKIRVYNAINSNSNKLRECVNKVLEVEGVYIEPAVFDEKDEDGEIIMRLDENGELVTSKTICPRMIIFTKDGQSYTSCSMGAYNSMKRIFAMFGTPDTWKEPLKIIPVIISKGKNQITSLNLA